jgi:diguanylate cyclase (GGDEF)-like protein
MENEFAAPAAKLASARQDSAPSPERLIRALRTLSAVNHALLQASSEAALLAEICRVLVEESGYRMAWISQAEHDAEKSIRPLAHAGIEEGWLATLPNTWADTERGRGPTGTAIRAGEPQVVREVLGDPRYALWRNEALRRGYASVISLPVRVDGTVTGALTIYAAEPDAFDDEERRLLVETAASLGFGISTLRARQRAGEADATIRHIANYDALTDLPNRMRLRELLAEMIVNCSRENRPFALLILSIGRFHDINEVFGYREGDKLVQEVARRVTGALLPADVAARVDENKFAVLLPKASANRATAIAKVLVGALTAPIELSGSLLEPQIGVGIALFPGHGTDPDTLIRHGNMALFQVRRGNMALFQAEQSGEDFALYSGQFDKDIAHRVSLIGGLRRAIENDELLLYCQPKVHIRSAKVCGAEALMRWRHPREGLIGPGEFVKLAERTGMISPLTHWMLDAAFRQTYAWHQAGTSNPLAVNLSAADLRDPKLLDHIRNGFATWGSEPDDMQFELTESALMEDPAGALETLSKLKSLGVRLLIDDFGTGYSSLSYLQKLPVDTIKIDQSFISRVTASEQSAAIVRFIIELAHTLKLEVVAEGVEDQATWERIAELGCDVVQGYWVSKPMPVGEFSDWQTQSRWHA